MLIALLTTGVGLHRRQRLFPVRRLHQSSTHTCACACADLCHPTAASLRSAPSSNRVSATEAVSTPPDMMSVRKRRLEVALLPLSDC